MRLILASASPRRAELLRRLNAEFDIEISGVDETIGANEDARLGVIDVAHRKAAVVADRLEAEWRAAERLISERLADGRRAADRRKARSVGTATLVTERRETERRATERRAYERRAYEDDRLITAELFASETIIIGADTVVIAPDGERLGKPVDRLDAKRMLTSLSGGWHLVHTGVVLVCTGPEWSLDSPGAFGSAGSSDMIGMPDALDSRDMIDSLDSLNVLNSMDSFNALDSPEAYGSRGAYGSPGSYGAPGSNGMYGSYESYDSYGYPGSAGSAGSPGVPGLSGSHGAYNMSGIPGVPVTSSIPGIPVTSGIPGVPVTSGAPRKAVSPGSLNITRALTRSDDIKNVRPAAELPPSYFETGDITKASDHRGWKVVRGVETTEVKFCDIDNNMMERYLSTGEYVDKAGAYAVQGYGAVLVEKIFGCYFNVMGLPIARLANMLKSCGYVFF